MSIRFHVCGCGRCNDNVIKQYLLTNIDLIEESIVKVFVNYVHYSKGEIFVKELGYGTEIAEYKDDCFVGVEPKYEESDTVATVMYSVYDVKTHARLNRKYSVNAFHTGTYTATLDYDFVEDYTRINQGCVQEWTGCNPKRWWTGLHLKEVLDRVGDGKYRFDSYTVDFPERLMYECDVDGNKLYNVKEPV